MVQKFFEKICLPMVCIDKPKDTYYIFRENGEKIEVQAPTAFAAIKKCEIKDIMKVRNISYKLYECILINDTLKILNLPNPEGSGAVGKPIIN